MPTVDSGSGARLLVRRPPPGGLGDLYPISIFVDGERVARLMPGESASSTLAPGRRRVRAHNTLLSRTVEVDVAAGDDLHLVAANAPSWWTTLLGFLGSGPLKVTLTRE